MLAAANLQVGSERYRNLVNFVEAFFTGFQTLLRHSRFVRSGEVHPSKAVINGLKPRHPTISVLPLVGRKPEEYPRP
jgi:hypothetical protein